LSIRLAVALFALLAWQRSDASEVQLLRYNVDHAVYGRIGIYENRIDRRADETVVQNEIHLLITVLGIVIHREDAERSERWNGQRLIDFHSVTTVNGDSVEVSGHAKEPGFEVTSPRGTTMAPADILPSNPWSAGFLSSKTMLQSDTGEIESIQVSSPESSSVKVDDRTIAATLYKISAHPAYQIWLGPGDIPVRFTVADDSGLVTFTLTTVP